MFNPRNDRVLNEKNRFFCEQFSLNYFVFQKKVLTLHSLSGKNRAASELLRIPRVKKDKEEDIEVIAIDKRQEAQGRV